VVYTYLAALVERTKGKKAPKAALEPAMQAGD
jgi:hypothetical protein